LNNDLKNLAFSKACAIVDCPHFV